MRFFAVALPRAEVQSEGGRRADAAARGLP
jgi:hypothetical protein